MSCTRVGPFVLLLSAAACLSAPSVEEQGAPEWVSWPQPPSSGYRGWNGRCGETAAANVITNVCGVETTPEQVAARGGDWSPGARPATLASWISQVCGSWIVVDECPAGPCELAARLGPQQLMPLLVQPEPGEPILHWVTLSEVRACDTATCEVEVLEYGARWTLPCADLFTEWQLDATLGIRVAQAIGGFGTCVRIERLPEPAPL